VKSVFISMRLRQDYRVEKHICIVRRDAAVGCD
jgi:hypothetical protein